MAGTSDRAVAGAGMGGPPPASPDSHDAPASDSEPFAHLVEERRDVLKPRAGERRLERRVGKVGLADARHVIGCHLTQETRVRSASDDVASIIR